MNKIYIKKRIIKEKEKKCDEEFGRWANNTTADSHTKRRRKRRSHRRSEDEDDYEPYSANVYNSNFSISNANANDEFNEYSKPRNFGVSWGDKVSREEKKLQYYLDMIRRQEVAEKKKEARKQNKENKTAIDESNNFPEPNSQVPVKITLVRESDPELERLANNIRSTMLWQEEYCKHINTKHFKDDLISWSQSDDFNESTLDRLRTPTQTNGRFSSIMSIGDDVTGFENFRFLNIINRPPFAPTGKEEKVDSNCSPKIDLQSEFWAKIIEMTRLKQESMKQVDRGMQTWQINNNPSIIKPLPRPLHKRNIFARQVKSYKFAETCMQSGVGYSHGNNSEEGLKPIFIVTKEKKRAKRSKEVSICSSISTVGTQQDGKETSDPDECTRPNKREAIVLIS